MTPSLARLLSSFTLFASLVAPAVQADETPPLAADSTAMLEALQAAPPRGLLYAVSKGDKKAWLFGTLHVGRADFYPLDWTTTQALARSTELVVEIDVLQQERMAAAVQRHALLQAPKKLGDLVPATLMNRVDAQFDALDTPRESVQPMKPWMAALTLTLLTAKRQGYSFEYASDLYLAALAQGLGKPVVELETVDRQFRIFDDVPPAGQLAFLDETLKALETGQARTDLQALIDAWLASDGARLQSVAARSFRDYPRSSRWLKSRLSTERNLDMARKVAGLLDAGRSPFVAVGALHLVGPDGLPALLRKRGYKIEAIYPVAAARAAPPR